MKKKWRQHEISNDKNFSRAVEKVERVSENLKRVNFLAGGLISAYHIMRD